MKKLILFLMLLGLTLFTSCGPYDIAYEAYVDYPIVYYNRPSILGFHPVFHAEPGFRPIQPRFNPPVNQGFKSQPDRRSGTPGGRHK